MMTMMRMTTIMLFMVRRDLKVAQKNFQ